MTESSKPFRVTVSKNSLNNFLSNIIPKGTLIPKFCIDFENSEVDTNKVVDWMEQQLESAINQVGLNYNYGIGPDIEHFDIEFKTRMKESNSYHTVGATNMRDIFLNYWKDSHLKRKVQLQYRVTYSNKHLNVTESRLYDFTDDRTQLELETAYMAAREDLVDAYMKGLLTKGKTYIKSDGEIAHFQLKSGTYDSSGNLKSGTFQFRVGHSYMNQILNRALTDKNVWSNSGLLLMPPKT